MRTAKPSGGWLTTVLLLRFQDTRKFQGSYIRQLLHERNRVRVEDRWWEGRWGGVAPSRMEGYCRANLACFRSRWRRTRNHTSGHQSQCSFHDRHLSSVGLQHCLHKRNIGFGHSSNAGLLPLLIGLPFFRFRFLTSILLGVSGLVPLRQFGLLLFRQFAKLLGIMSA